MKVLLIGGGGREHALAYKIAQSSKVTELYCAPGNAGIEEYAICVPIGVMEFDRLAEFAATEKIDLTVVGPDDPLVGGIVDVFKKKGLRVFGPDKKSAIIEGSKAFAKDLMKKYNIPTAAYETFTSSDAAYSYLESCKYPVVLKADGLALGKGVLICNTKEEARDGVKLIMDEKQFGTAGDVLVVEEFMTGREVSVLAFCDGTDIAVMTSAQDHKRALDGDMGLNTGGMGTFSPSPFYTEEIDAYCMEHLFKPTMSAMKQEGRSFTGILFFGLMLTEEGPKLLEYNARFGDPETQVVLPRLQNDIVEIFEACIDEGLKQIQLSFDENAAVCIVLASEGYPLSYEKGYEITGLEELRDENGVFAFHAGTKKENGKIVTAGGRVLGITATGNSLKEARHNAYKAVETVNFKNKYMRKDIGKAIDEL